MKSKSAWIVYSIIRLGIFAVMLAVLLLLHVNPLVAAVAAAVIALCISYLFLRKQREAMSSEIYRRTHGESPDIDNDIENAALDELEVEQHASETAVTPEHSEPPQA